MEIIPRQFRAPELFGDFWFNSEPISIRALRGSVILVDFWDYSCINCIRTLPYMSDWFQKYREFGLVVVGVHTPEFKFARNPESIQRAIERLKVEYPVVSDNDAIIWSAFSNRYWPTKYLIDKDGFIRYSHQGEGGYDQFERAIQALLAEAGIHGELPELTEPVRDTDIPGSICYKMTGEVHTGYLRGALGNTEGYSPESTLNYLDGGIYLPGRFYADGKWISEKESVRFNGEENEVGHIVIRYEAAEVNAVVNVERGKNCKVFVEQDGTWLPAQNRGSDVLVAPDRATYVMVDEGKMFNLIKNKEFGEHVLRLTTSDPRFQLYAFSFVTAIIPAAVHAN